MNRIGKLETGLLMKYMTIPKGGYPETMVTIHCFGSHNKVSWLSARFYFKGSKSSVTDGFFHWITDDIKGIIEKQNGITINEDFVIHSEYYAGVIDFLDEIPFDLGDYTLK